MSASEDSTAGRARPQLGLMARAPVPGRVKTRLAPPMDEAAAARLYAAFLEDMLALGSTGWDRTIHWVREPDDEELPLARDGWRGTWQAEGDLGARLEAAFSQLFARGAPVVLLGSDHPDLPEAVLVEALHSLRESDLVLGPTPDGGYYLIGLRAPAPGLLRDVPWSTPTVYAKTAAAAAARGLRLGALPVWPDVDTWEDVLSLGERLRGTSAGATATRLALRELGVGGGPAGG